LLAPAARHGAEELRVEKRHQAMEGVSVCLYVEFLHGKAADADSADATLVHTSSDEGLNRKIMRRADQMARWRQRRQR